MRPRLMEAMHMDIVWKIVEKTVMTWLEVFLGLVIISAWLVEGDSSLALSSVTAAAIAAIPAALTALAAALPQVGEGLPFVVDLVLRTLRTFVVTFVGLLVAAPTFDLSIDTWQAAAVGALPAALAVAKGLLSKRVGDSSSPALLPTSIS